MNEGEERVQIKDSEGFEREWSWSVSVSWVRTRRRSGNQWNLPGNDVHFNPFEGSSWNKCWIDGIWLISILGRVQLRLLWLVVRMSTRTTQVAACSEGQPRGGWLKLRILSTASSIISEIYSSGGSFFYCLIDSVGLRNDWKWINAGRSRMQDLIELTSTIHYENFRRRRLQEMKSLTEINSLSESRI